MAENIVASLFGLNPQMYGEQQRRSALNEGIALAQLDPASRGAAMTYAGARGLGGAIAGAMGVEDPQLQMIAKRQQLLTQLDLTSPQSLIEGAKLATSSGDAQLAAGLIDRARSLQESQSKISLQQAQALKALQPNKLTGDERYISDLRTVESKILEGKEPTANELSNANMAAQMLAKPRSFFDQASGQTVTIPATDPSKAFPETFKAMAKTEAAGGIGVPKPTVQTATTGNIPAGSQKDIGDIDANLKKLELSAPELQSFLGSLKSGEVKYNATSNTLDLLGATVLPAFGLPEQGAQVKKDEIRRALTERVNSLLLMAKGTQTEGDATRAADQIASTTTYLSQARMIGAIEGLMRAESKLSAELGAKKTALQSQGRTEVGVTPPTQEVPPMAAPTKQATPSAPKPTSSSTGLSREQKIKLFIDHNGGKPTRQEAIDALTAAGRL
jgi:hypothetical protein